MVQEKRILRGKRNIICELYGYIYKGSIYIYIQKKLSLSCVRT